MAFDARAAVSGRGVVSTTVSTTVRTVQHEVHVVVDGIYTHVTVSIPVPRYLYPCHGIYTRVTVSIALALL